jgi:1-acyl-sn-glycerol-3-phosphate acyltransferase
MPTPQLPTHLLRIRRIARMRAILDTAYRLLTRREVEGLEYLPSEGGFLLVFNHLTNFDPHLLFTVARRDRATGLTAAEYRSRPLHRFLVESCGGIWLRRGAGDRRALDLALALLAEGWMVGLAPEGRRSPTGALRPGRPGAAFLALRSGAPIVPAAVMGTEAIASALRSGRRARVRVRFGPPFRLAAEQRSISRQALQRHTGRIMSEIAALLDPGYRGAYGGAGGAAVVHSPHPRSPALIRGRPFEPEVR